MGSCELCGKLSEKLIKVKIAGSEMAVCSSCKSKGEVLEDENKVVSHTFYHKKRERNQVDFFLVKNYASLINSSIAKKKLTPHHLSRVLNIKESTLSKILSGKFKPEISIINKLENFLEIKLIDDTNEVEKPISELEKIKRENSYKQELSDNGLTLADLIKAKMDEKNGN